MQVTSLDWKRIYADPNHYDDVAILAPRVAPITVANILSLRTSISLLDTGPAVGRCPARELDTEILMEGVAEIPPGAALTVSCTVRVGEEYAPPINKGIFYIDTRKPDVSAEGQRTLKIHGFDAMLMAEQPYPKSNLQWPAKDYEVVREICMALGWQMTEELLAIVTQGFSIEYPAQYSCRETLAGIAALYAAFIYLDENGQLTAMRFGDGEPVTDLGRSLNNLTLGDPLPRVSKIRLSNDSAGGETVAEFTAGPGGGREMAVDAPWISQFAANKLFVALQSYQYRPFEASGLIADPALQVGDTVVIAGQQVTIYNEDLAFGRLYTGKYSAPYEEETNHESPYRPQGERAVQRRVANVSTSLKIQAGKIQAEVEERAKADRILNSNITQEAGRISTEIKDRQDADNILQSNITQEAGRIASEIKARQEADTTLQSNITQEAGRITSEIKARQSAVSGLQSQITQQAGEISAKVSATGGTAASFAYSLKSTGFKLTAGDKVVFNVTKNGAELNGKITATEGLIGGWTLSKNKLSAGGTDGLLVAAIQAPSAGTNWVFAAGGTSHESYSDCPFRVDKQGRLWATKATISGTLNAVDGNFSGTVRANKILWSGDNGYFSGAGLSSNSVTTAETCAGINTSLGHANFADDVFNNRDEAINIGCRTITIRGQYLGLNSKVAQWMKKTIGGVTIEYIGK